MNVPSLDIVEMLEADSTVNSADFPISRGVFDEASANCAVIRDIAGASPQLTMDRAKYEFPSIQIQVRCTDYDAGWAFIESIKDSLHGRAHEQWNGSYYSLIECVNGPGFLERVNQRSIFNSNFNIQRREA